MGEKPGNGVSATVKNFAIGGASGMAGTAVNLPLDYIKVHLQVAREGHRVSTTTALSFARATLQQNGWRVFYSGLDSALLRQAVYGTVRLGLYRTLSDNEKAKSPTSVLPLWKKAVISSISGGVGAIVGNPADLTLVRMQADKRLPLEKRRNYGSVTQAFGRIWKEEGVLTFWRGSLSNVLRCVAMNVGMLAPYDQSNEFLSLYFPSSPLTRLLSSTVAVFCACVLSLPFDNVKTKYQTMRPVNGVLPYTSLGDCILKTIRFEGASGFYVGFWMFAMKVAPHITVSLLMQDLLHYLFD